MTTLHMRSPDGKQVMSIYAGRRRDVPFIPEWARKEGWVIVDQKEFERLRRKQTRRDMSRSDRPEAHERAV